MGAHSSTCTSFKTVSTFLAVNAALAAGSGLRTIGHSISCMSDATVSIRQLHVHFNSDNLTVSFYVSGTSRSTINIIADLQLTAAGNVVFARHLDPCDDETFVSELCPVPAGDFATWHSQTISRDNADQVPAIVYKIPDIDAMSNLKLLSEDTREVVACVENRVTNGITTDIPGLTYAAVAVAGSALILAAASSFLPGHGPAGPGPGTGAETTGGAGPSFSIGPTLADVLGWFQTMALDSMLSVNYPLGYRNFAKNFGFSVGLTPWSAPLQPALDRFRADTGGDLTNNSVDALHYSVLEFPDGSLGTPGGSSQHGSDDGTTRLLRLPVGGTPALGALLGIPPGNIFMSALVALVVVAAVVLACAIALKLLLELWHEAFPKRPLPRFDSFRRSHWAALGRLVTLVIWIFYSPWVWLCSDGFLSDSGAVRALAAVSFVVSTAVLLAFSWKIWDIPRRDGGSPAALFQDERNWARYSIFYSWYRREFWWVFLPTLVYKFARGIISLLRRWGAPQVGVKLVAELAMLGLLVWSRPYVLRSGNAIGIMIQAVGTISAALVVVFLPELQPDETRDYILGLVLVAIQAGLSIILVILMVADALISMCKANPHVRHHMDRRAAKETGERGDVEQQAVRVQNKGEH